MAVLATACAAPPAIAGTVTLSWQAEPEDGQYDVPTMVFRAAPGERNRVVLDGTASSFDITDVTPIRLVVRQRRRSSRLPRCRRLSAQSVRCAREAASGGSRFLLGDGDDRFSAPAAHYILALGGAGDDVLRGPYLRGGPGRDRLVGGPGSDQLLGERGRDRLRGGGGDDHLCGDCAAARPQRDDIAGGRGDDEVVFNRADELHVDLSRPGPDGEEGAGDRLRDIENVRVWSERNAVLIGDEAPNRLIADGPGSDRLEGGGGDDLVSGWRGDHLSGGAGRDIVTSQGPAVDSPPAPAPRLFGGEGEDFIEPQEPDSVVDCGAGDDVMPAMYADPRRPDVGCEFYSDEQYGPDALDDPLWIGRDLRVADDALHVTVKWRRTTATSFSARATGSGPTFGVALAETSGELAPGASSVRVPFTEAGRAHEGWFSEKKLLSVTSSEAPTRVFVGWLAFAPAG